jgi:glycosyltransferase involved in cell wall biosynthesis
MRVLHVITGLAAGGAEQGLRDLLKHSRHDAEVVTLTNDGVLAQEIRADGTPVTDLGMRGNTDLAALPRLVKHIRGGNFDVVHTHLYRACLYGRAAARWAGIRRIVATEHSLGENMIEGRPADRPGVRELYLAAERLGQLTIAVSPTVVELLLRWGVPEPRIRMIPNGTDAASFRFDPASRHRVRAQLGIGADSRVVGTVGRLTPAKHVERLVEAVRDLPGVVLLLVGGGPARPELERLVREWGIGDRVVFTGESRDVSAMLSAMDVYVSASPGETFGISILEAVASGLPAVYVTCPAIDDLPSGTCHGVRRVGSDAAGLRAGIVEFLDAPRQLTPPEFPMYGVAHAAAQVDELYDSLRRRPSAAMSDVVGRA